jgi:penicillin-binding protein 1A
VQVEKLLDDAAKTADKTSATEQPKPAKPVQSGSLAFPDSFAAATPGDAVAPRKN